MSLEHFQPGVYHRLGKVPQEDVMGDTLYDLMTEVDNIPADKLWPGTPLSERTEEISILDRLAPPNPPHVKKGVLPDRTILVRVTDGRQRLYELIIAKDGERVQVRRGGGALDIVTAEQFQQYISELCSDETIPKAGA